MTPKYFLLAPKKFALRSNFTPNDSRRELIDCEFFVLRLQVTHTYFQDSRVNVVRNTLVYHAPKSITRHINLVFESEHVMY